MTDEETIAPAEGNNEQELEKASAAGGTSAACGACYSSRCPCCTTASSKRLPTKILEGVKLPGAARLQGRGRHSQAFCTRALSRLSWRNALSKAAPAAQSGATPIPSGARRNCTPKGGTCSSSIVAPVRTLKDDLANRRPCDQNISLVKAATLEEEKRDKVGNISNRNSERSKRTDPAARRASYSRRRFLFC